MDQIKAALFGLAVGDALGVPVEFRERDSLSKSPVTDMRGYGSHNQPPGTWSDDSSLAFCLADALTVGFDLSLIAQNFVNWRYHQFWTPHGEVFDIGITTSEAIYRLKNGAAPATAGGFYEDENGNGSLMRILPLLFYHRNKPVEERFELTKLVSSITHGHMRAVIACFYYLEFARLILGGKNKLEVFLSLQQTLPGFIQQVGIHPGEIAKFNRLLKEDLQFAPESTISSGGYVLHTLEASIWCILTTDNYTDAVLKAVNLGRDTDTTGAVTGGLAGLIYGLDGIPGKWINQLARRKDIDMLAERMAAAGQ
ncbi:ADP-ribosylglycohydrolase family protein [Chitinophaga sp. 22321]|uniref:ADP-ribosylglycohydrolase family protein n=1 Tax=Chitinophaga hostae TaxID=2831022 RepID=A0ABS5IXQ5_9BACT|nr:ADP-ribosylglycohydrolase family protein [Chitinophaga hostae]MBS0027740.1 ADP-ribosylglycohydrolase family protein [Chitinophaga hostae]